MTPAVDDLLDLQGGVIARRQLVSRGWADHDIARMLRRRVWASVSEGIYVNHTGGLTWLQRAWAAVLFSWPAALSHGSALRAADGPGRRDADEGLVHVMVERDRRLVCPPGVEVHRRRAFGKHVLWNLGPPRVRYEQAAIDVATSVESEYAAVAVLSQAVQSRRTTARRMLSAMAERERLPRRQWVAGVLRDIEEGTCSVLEHGYLARVERPSRATPRPTPGRRTWGSRVASIGTSPTACRWSSSSTVVCSMTRPVPVTRTSTATSSPRSTASSRPGCHGVRSSTAPAGRLARSAYSCSSGDGRALPPRAAQTAV